MRFVRCIGVLLLSLGLSGHAITPSSAVPDEPTIKKMDAAAPISDQANDKSNDKPEEASPEPKPRAIALIVPLASKVLDKAADAVKRGFIVASQAEGKSALPYRIYAAEDENASLMAQYKNAVDDGALAIVGGITREGANTISKLSGLLPTLALNAPTISATPTGFFFVSLSLDNEARQMARTAFDDGARRMVVLATTNALAKRIQESFEREWKQLGGEIVARINYSGDPSEAERIKPAMEKWWDKQTEKYQVDAVFISADVRTTRLARPYLPAGMPIYATSHSFDPRAEAVENIDLEGVRLFEMPWFVERDHPAVMIYARPDADLSIDYERLYALGIDAWRLTQLILQNERARSIPTLDGVTGRLGVDAAHQFMRSLSQIEIRDGRARLYRPTE
ncbi:MAG: penicillin-binding protein activator [Betaproteobacteria bacterium]|nr:penicillin-binding protein activator [Betaproteobacteria bacterium]